MQYDNETSDDLIDLGTASGQTLGADGMMTDFVRYMDHWGVSDA